MATIHIAQADGQTIQLDEAEARRLAESGELGAGTLYWEAGMAAWEPIERLLRRGAEPAEEAARIPSPAYAYEKDPARLTRVLKIFLGAYIAAAALMLAADLAQLAYIHAGDFSDVAADRNDFFQGVAAFIYLIVFIATAVVFLKWIYRACLNCHGFGAEGMQFTPGWAVGWYFVPIMNWFRPFQSMAEIWKVSEDPVRWRSRYASPLLAWWWGLWIVSGFVASLGSHAGLRTPGELATGTIVAIIGLLLKIALGCVALRLVASVARLQARLTETAG